VHRVTGNAFSGNGYNRVLIGAGGWRPGPRLRRSRPANYELENVGLYRSGVTLTLEPTCGDWGGSNTHLQVDGHLEGWRSLKPDHLHLGTDTGPASGPDIL